ncbi:hypothetical protein MUN46_004450 [Mesosutterella sp. AGMB02718]|uniref:Uncharacterized protein n=1 Tax=Mesosutterella faecium TaxID=2925194 RepID=A0ABT7IKT7_9BURK|nr:hypothetical protein [Mesosutterella sp. AGMB02718]MDL2058533.1 hypothetical protein [Mesosutterella sp. AGMB02718]MDL2059186.1 hypothetical protein [Mesosutterella sp. AGMB02718]
MLLEEKEAAEVLKREKQGVKKSDRALESLIPSESHSVRASEKFPQTGAKAFA